MVQKTEPQTDGLKKKYHEQHSSTGTWDESHCRWWKAQRAAGVGHMGFESWLYHYLALGLELVNLPL